MKKYVGIIISVLMGFVPYNKDGLDGFTWKEVILINALLIVIFVFALIRHF
jgi:hypothetical protein